MSKVIFDGKGFTAEKLAVSQFGGELTSNKEDQYRDIDAFIADKSGKILSVSIKDQLWSSGKYKAIQIELELTDSRTGATMDGCFVSCEADYYFWRITTVEYGDTWASVPVDVMQRYVAENVTRLKTWRTTNATEAKNRSYNRKYDRASGVTISIMELSEIAKFIKVKG